MKFVREHEWRRLTESQREIERNYKTEQQQQNTRISYL